MRNAKLILVIVALAASIAIAAPAVGEDFEYCTSQSDCGGSLYPCYQCIATWDPDRERYIYACGWAEGCYPSKGGGEFGSGCYGNSDCIVGLCCSVYLGECSWCFPSVDNRPLFAEPEDLLAALAGDVPHC